MYTYMHACMHTCILAYIYTYIHTYMHAYTYMHTFIHACIHTDIQIDRYIDVYIYRVLHPTAYLVTDTSWASAVVPQDQIHVVRLVARARRHVAGLVSVSVSATLIRHVDNDRAVITARSE